MPKRSATTEAVIELRAKARAAPKQQTFKAFAQAQAMPEATLRRLLLGQTYADVPGALTTEELSFAAPRPLSDEQVLAYRREFRDNRDSLTKKSFARRIGLSETATFDMLTGLTYADVPEALDPLIMTTRRFPDEVALFMRLTYNPRTVSAARLARAFGVDTNSMTSLLTGKSYSNVPCALERLRHGGCKPELTDEQVITARRQFRTRQVSMQTLARECGVVHSTMKSAIRGLTHKHLPGAVPEHIRSMRTGMGKWSRRKRAPEPAAFLQAAE